MPVSQAAVLPVRSQTRLTPAQLVTISFLGFIVVGTVGYMLPFAATKPEGLGFLNAFFTATSAVCVTGLIVVDTATDLTPFGQALTLVLIQAGGLGYMVITTLVVTALGGRLTLQERLSLREQLNVQSGEGLVRFTLTVFRLTLAFELVGAVILAARWWPEMGPQAAWIGFFHAVSAFNNAGFSLFADSLVRYRGDLIVNLVVTFLVICGGLGFLVLSELLRPRRKLPLSLHTRLVLSVSGALIVGAMAMILALEWHNPRTLGAMGLSESLLAAWFQAVSARTAGFNTIDIGAMRPATLFVMMALMFIGASPGGTGGGVKTTTFSITVAALWATVRREQEAVIFRRRVADTVVARAFFICLIGFLSLNLVAWSLLVVEPYGVTATLFEATSAFGTVGLSTGHSESVLSLAGHMGTLGKLLIIGMMIAGRIGPMTLAVALAHRGAGPRIRYPEGKVPIG
jgi:trk/ktr system potassium uptake protein